MYIAITNNKHIIILIVQENLGSTVIREEIKCNIVTNICLTDVDCNG